MSLRPWLLLLVLLVLAPAPAATPSPTPPLPGVRQIHLKGTTPVAWERLGTYQRLQLRRQAGKVFG
ncbi:MAG: hypothetical protein AB7S38_26735 [Vulcanimicrobiota bacterium]